MNAYLSKEILAGFDSYKYSAIDTSPVSNYVCHPFWNKVVKIVPLWIAPNLLTLSGFLMLVFNFFLMTYYDPHFYASSRDFPENPPIPNWVWLVAAFCNFLSHTLDGIDGKQARRTKTSSPLGELFDHGLDSWATLFLPVGLYSIFGRGEYGVGVYRVYFVIIGIMFCFVVSHWEKYNTGVLFLPWGYDIGQIGMTGVYLITYIFGYEMWKFTVPLVNLTAAELFEIVCYLGFLGLTFPFTFWNVYQSYVQKTGKMRPFSEAMRPLVSTLALFVLMIVWVTYSPYDIVEKQSRLIYWTTGTAFSNIACQLIISQMSSTRCEFLNPKLLPLLGVVAASLLMPLGQGEVYLLWAYCIFVTLDHIYFGVLVVQEMCKHLKINALTIKPVENGHTEQLP
ncbi:ethanolaminephosphotransferase 1-like isoform X2 [Littorina saxatilis]|uniref:Ethanolaminephosphotransferase 1 n=1 Tax=Littorina saxatilis TaxID=31220 RepID=A0AAN9G9B5_9CAEN